MDKPKLYLVTDMFPYGKGEKPFLIPELPHLTEAFEVTILTRADKKTREDVKNITKLDKRIKVISTPVPLIPKGFAILKLIRCIFYLFDKRVQHEIKDIIRKRKNIIKRLIFMFFNYSAAYDFIKDLKRKNIPLNQTEPILFYTYWNTFATLGLLMCKEKNPNLKVITRTHGYDLYNERPFGGRQPFREYENTIIDGIFFVSKKGMDYYISHFPQPVKRRFSIFHLQELGIPDHKKQNPAAKEGESFCLVSCSNVIPLKRVELIIKALADITNRQTEEHNSQTEQYSCRTEEYNSQTEQYSCGSKKTCLPEMAIRKINWIHFGNGSEMETVQKLASELLDSQTNIQYVFKGFVENEEVMEYYANHHVDCFITTSSSEGLPVSIMEACSFGIPVIATNVGGISEIVKNRVGGGRNGILLSANPSVVEIAEAIEKIYDMPEKEITQMRINSRWIWEDNFNADKNYSRFVDEIKRLVGL